MARHTFTTDEIQLLRDILSAPESSNYPTLRDYAAALLRMVDLEVREAAGGEAVPADGVEAFDTGVDTIVLKLPAY